MHAHSISAVKWSHVHGCVGVASYSDAATEQQKCCVHASHCALPVWPVHTGIHRHTQTHK